MQDAESGVTLATGGIDCILSFVHWLADAVWHGHFGSVAQEWGGRKNDVANHEATE